MSEQEYTIKLTYVELGWLTSCVMLQRIDKHINHETAKSVEYKLNKMFLPLLQERMKSHETR